MSQPFKRNYLQHALSVGHWMRQRGAVGGIDPLSHILEKTGHARNCQVQLNLTLVQSVGQIELNPQELRSARSTRTRFQTVKVGSSRAGL